MSDEIEKSVWNSIMDSVWHSVRTSVYDSVGNSIRTSVGDFVERPIEVSTKQKLCDINEEVLICLIK
jgi:hypothetical protein